MTKFQTIKRIPPLDVILLSRSFILSSRRLVLLIDLACCCWTVSNCLSRSPRPLVTLEIRDVSCSIFREFSSSFNSYRPSSVKFWRFRRPLDKLWRPDFSNSRLRTNFFFHAVDDLGEICSDIFHFCCHSHCDSSRCLASRFLITN